MPSLKYYPLYNIICNVAKMQENNNICVPYMRKYGISVLKVVYYTLFKTEELFLINYPGLLTPDLECVYHEYS